MYDKYVKLAQQMGMNDTDVSRALGIPRATFTDWKAGRYTVKGEKLKKIADYFGVSVGYFFGEEEPKKYKRIPVVGKIAAGIPIEAIEDILDYEEIPSEWEQKGEFVGLMVKGDSMSPKIDNGDIVIIKRTEDVSDVNNGDIVAIAIGEEQEFTLKKIMFKENGIILIPLNPAYETRAYNNGEYYIYGRVVELRAKFRM